MIYLKIDIPKIEERYIIYKNGDIFDKKLRKYCKKYLNKKGYHCVWIANIGKKLYVHRLVLCKYNPTENEIYLQVNHKNTIKTDNRIDNLEWITQSKNQTNAFEDSLILRQEDPNSQREWINLTKNIEFSTSKYSNNINSIYNDIENKLLEYLKNGKDIDYISNKLNLSKRYIKDFKYRKLGIY